MVKLSIIVPAYNEEKRLGKTLRELREYLSHEKIYYELIVIDDGSTDSTRIVALRDDAFLNPIRKNRGKGFSVSEGVLMATGDCVLFMDADGSTDINHIKQFMNYCKKYDVVLASRAMGDSRVKTSLFKKIAGRASNFLISSVVKDIKDTQCGFKMFKLKVAIDLFSKLTIDEWGFDVEVLYLAQQKGYSIKEVGVKWINNNRSKVRLSDYPKTLLDIIKIKRNKYE